MAAHAKLSPSAASRWLNCPGSVALCATLPTPPSTYYADEGTAAHALAEDRHFYVPLMQHDAGIDLSRHAIAEHHAIDELVEELEKTDPSSPGWLATAKKLTDKVHHHLEEEEHRFFQMAGKLLTERQKTALAASYLADYEEAKAATA